MRDHYQEFRDKGAEVVAIGMGWPEAAADFRDEYRIPFPILVDHTKDTYRALGFQRASLLEIYKLNVIFKGAIEVMTGNRLRQAKQDWHMLGGAVVVERGGDVKLVHRSKDPADMLPVEDLLDAVPD